MKDRILIKLKADIKRLRRQYQETYFQWERFNYKNPKAITLRRRLDSKQMQYDAANEIYKIYKFGENATI